MIFKSSQKKTILTSIAALTVFLPVSACDLANNFTKIDRSTNSEVQDFRDAMAPREAESADADANAVPDLQSYTLDDTSAMKSYPLVSLSINQSIPLREALFELAKQADYDIELDPRISGSVIFTARNKPFDEVVDKLCEISGLRYKFGDNSIRVEVDTPYTKNYKIDYLSFVRKNSSSVKTDVSVTSSGEATASGGSKFGIESVSESNFWAELDLNLKQILASNASPNFMKTNEDPQITLTTANPVKPPVPPIDGAALSETAPQAGSDDYISTPQMVTQDANASATVEGGTPSSVAPPSDANLASPSAASPVAAAPATDSAPAPAATPSAQVTESDAPPAPQPVATQPVAPAQQPVLKVESLPTALSSGASGANAVQFTPAYSINKQAGMVSIYANERIHRQVSTYLEELRKASTSQVLIEAKVLEVTLTDEFSAGIDWNLLDKLGAFDFRGNFSQPALDPAVTTGNGLAVGFLGSDLTFFASALSRFGTVHALASPRLTVLNNQSAVLSVAKNQVYFKLDVTTDTTGTGADQVTNTKVDTDIKTVPEGVMINVLPSIDLSKRMVSMQVRPTITKITGYVSDPGVAFVANSAGIDIESRIPVMNVQEVDSVLSMKDKQMMVMGGLLQDSSQAEQVGLPVAGEVPVFGSLFRSQGDKVLKKELVVFIKATILDSPSDSIHQTDKELYRTFGQDRRPEKL